MKSKSQSFFISISLNTIRSVNNVTFYRSYVTLFISTLLNFERTQLHYPGDQHSINCNQTAIHEQSYFTRQGNCLIADKPQNTGN